LHILRASGRDVDERQISRTGLAADRENDTAEAVACGTMSPARIEFHASREAVTWKKYQKRHSQVTVA
jgi:hypothetical protein